MGVSALALVAAACASSGHPSAAAGHAKSAMPEMSSSMPMPSPSMSMGGGMLPMGAKHMHVAITSPAAGAKVTGNSVTVQVRVSGYQDTCALAGKHVMGTEATTTGHYHVPRPEAAAHPAAQPQRQVQRSPAKRSPRNNPHPDNPPDQPEASGPRKLLGGAS